MKDDPYIYSEENMKYLRQSIAQVESGKGRKIEVAVLVIDMQNDFVLPGAVLNVAGAQATIPAIQELIKFGRSKGWPIIYINREHDASGADADLPRRHLFANGKPGYCVAGTKGCEIVDGLKPLKGDIIIKKHRNSGFFQTELNMVLSSIGVKTVIISGTQYPNCVRGTAVDAMSYDYNTIVCTDACSAQTKAIAEANILDMKNMGITCIPLEEVKIVDLFGSVHDDSFVRPEQPKVEQRENL